MCNVLFTSRHNAMGVYASLYIWDVISFEANTRIPTTRKPTPKLPEKVYIEIDVIMSQAIPKPNQSRAAEGSIIDPRRHVGTDNGNETSDLATLVHQSRGLDRATANRFWDDRLRETDSALNDQLTQLTGFPSAHDHTKDTWYMVVTALVFSMQLKELVCDVMDDVIGDHVAAEPHHEAYFERTKEVPTPDNVLEMALDRLARNLQKNGGVYNWEQMERFLPKWPRHLADKQDDLMQTTANRTSRSSSRRTSPITWLVSCPSKLLIANGPDTVAALSVVYADHGVHDICASVTLIAKHSFTGTEINMETETDFTAALLECTGNSPFINGARYRPSNTNQSYMEKLSLNIRELHNDNPRATLWIAGDANLPDIDWETDVISGNSNPLQINRCYLDTMHDIGSE
ncbi:hypothetical protein LSAT2_000155 [Lamellibrachia satsuma]|nr:hypothetical protein LSAT2_000155 [Lamellibrachia satsuma]